MNHLKQILTVDEICAKIDHGKKFVSNDSLLSFRIGCTNIVGIVR